MLLLTMKAVLVIGVLLVAVQLCLAQQGGCTFPFSSVRTLNTRYSHNAVWTSSRHIRRVLGCLSVLGYPLCHSTYREASMESYSSASRKVVLSAFPPPKTCEGLEVVTCCVVSVAGTGRLLRLALVRLACSLDRPHRARIVYL